MLIEADNCCEEKTQSDTEDSAGTAFRTDPRIPLQDHVSDSILRVIETEPVMIRECLGHVRPENLHPWAAVKCWFLAPRVWSASGPHQTRVLAGRRRLAALLMTVGDQ